MATPTFEPDADGIHFWFHHDCTVKRDTSLMPHYGGTWRIVSGPGEPMTVMPSIHCAVDNGGCGLHGWITDGKWVGV